MRVIRCVAVLLPVLESIKICFLTVSGHMGIGYVPLHLCSMSIFLYPIIAFSGNRSVRAFLFEISFCTLLPAAVSALVFPDWTMYPMISFMNIYAYLWHTLQVLFPIFILVRGGTELSVRHLWRNTVFLVGVGIPVYLFDRVFSCNYWFLLYPIPGTPLVPLSGLFGGAGYLPGLLLAATMVKLCMYGILSVVKRRR